MTWRVFRGLDLYYTDPAQHLMAAGRDPDDLHNLHDLDHDLCGETLTIKRIIYRPQGPKGVVFRAPFFYHM